ncbi:MAG: pilin [Patescibacteria group bacterium]|nr:pilin [Patescibacteria group bacterium]MCL5224095.1 pilin [Patescibacteria group bacterium]
MQFLISKVYAQAGTGSPGGSQGALPISNPLAGSGINNFGQLVNVITNYFVTYIAPTVAIIMVLYGAFRMLTAGGNPDNFAVGRKTVLWAIAGYALVLIAAGLVSVIQTTLGPK